MAGIDELKLDGAVLTRPSESFASLPADHPYKAAHHRFSALTEREAKYIAFPTSYSDVSKLITFARSNSLDLAIKCGGHTTNDTGNSSSQGGLVIDLKNLSSVTVAEDKNSVVVQAGALWGNVYEETAKAGLDLVGGDVASVGVGGFLTGGGYSKLSGTRGLGADNILEATVALADGRIVQASETSEQDLFWAIRGAPGRFGVVLEFVLRAYPTQGPAYAGPLVFPGTAFEAFVPVLDELLSKIGPQDHIIVEWSRSAPHYYPGIVVLPWIPGPDDRTASLLAPLRALNPIVDYVHPVPTQAEASHGGDGVIATAPRRQFMGGSQLHDCTSIGLGEDKELFVKMWEEFVSWTEKKPEDGEDGEGEFKGKGVGTMRNLFMWQWQPVGVVKEKGSGEIAFSKRESLSYVLVHARHHVEAFDQKNIDWVRRTVGLIREKHPRGGVLPNFACGDEPAEEMYGPENAQRLREVKKKYDPEDLFKKGAVL